MCIRDRNAPVLAVQCPTVVLGAPRVLGMVGGAARAQAPCLLPVVGAVHDLACRTCVRLGRGCHKTDYLTNAGHFRGNFAMSLRPGLQRGVVGEIQRMARRAGLCGPQAVDGGHRSQHLGDGADAVSAGVGAPRGNDKPVGGARVGGRGADPGVCLLYTSPSPRDVEESRMPSSA